MHSFRNELIRRIAAGAGGAAIGSSLVATCQWLTTAATTSVFVTFVTWLIGAVLLAVAAAVCGAAAHAVLTDALIDRAFDRMHAAFAGLRAKVAA